ncbi:hypothetical protein [Oceanicola sp. S124]|uniref:hypothetical protein n=1 Tax=Oceanicola sp. S124 TaxID=1042378 RepID=UPI0002559CCF|nr:hypothetical protein [Oceanicola sp. S124]
MPPSRDFRLYLSQRLIRSAEAGTHGFLTRLCKALTDNGYSVELLRTGRAARDAAHEHPGWAMFHMEHPTHDRALVFRKVYHAPFWAIERVAERWRWPVADARFPRRRVDQDRAAAFYARWQGRLFGDLPQRATREGFVYIPLQGRLLDHRSFQSCAPIEMLERTLEGEKTRPLLATLHPKESYTPEELAALDNLCRRFPRLQLVERPMQQMLAGCDYVVTQNSSAAFFGFFFGKPGLTFAQSDFHHICLGPRAFPWIAAHQPAFDRYIWWFWQDQSVNTGAPDAEAQIAARLERCGVPMRGAETQKGAPEGTPFAEN